MGSIAETKNNIHRLVVETEDPEVLEKVQAFFLSLKQSSTLDWWDFISDKEKKLIEQGLAQLANGETVPHAEVRKDVQALFNRKMQRQ
jgi:predicted transcriptional regulator